ncbi:uncharacterized protein LOC141628713 [Silene latifolia]|uniref:uncharacterized protein LOC141628713 n=1 Tax=Silene latifolia TaxID=37657 RepID=UPI003D776FB4
MKGVEKALEKEFPQATRRICAQHLYSNFKEKFPGPLYHHLFWTAANATSFYVRNNMLDKMGSMSPAAVGYLLNVPQQWSKHQFDPEVACDHNTSIFVESFNALINDLREKPILELMEGIRTNFMEKFVERKDLSEKVEMNGPTPYAAGILETNCAHSRIYGAIRGGNGEFEVHEGGSRFPVNLLTGTCLCGEWQITGIPCKHACRAIYANREEPVHYLHGFYTGQCYRLTYLDHLRPLPDKDHWPTFQFPKILPPVQDRGIGRPTRQRKRKPDDPKKRKGKRATTITCSICKTSGHNARSCQGGPTAKQKKVAAAVSEAIGGASPTSGTGRKRIRNDGASSSHP